MSEFPHKMGNGPGTADPAYLKAQGLNADRLETLTIQCEAADQQRSNGTWIRLLDHTRITNELRDHFESINELNGKTIIQLSRQITALLDELDRCDARDDDVDELDVDETRADRIDRVQQALSTTLDLNIDPIDDATLARIAVDALDRR